jgi:hypothetical protein
MRTMFRVICSIAMGLTMSATVGAQTISVGSASGTPGGATTPVLVPVSFTRNPAAPVADFVYRVNYTTANLDATVAGINGGGCSVNDASGFVTVLPPAGLSDIQSNTYCNITFTIAPAAPAPSTQNLTLTAAPGGICIDSNADPVPCSVSNGAISVTAGSQGPALAYNPTAGASAGTGGPVNFTGITTAGTTGNGQVAVTPSGGVASGTTTLGSFSISGADAASFTRTSAATLTFTAGINTPQNITLTCVSSTVARTANLQATETINGGATSQRFWVLSCPAGSLGPSLAYNPTAGASAGTGGPVNFTGVTTVGTTGNGQVAVTPSGGALAATTTLGSFSITGADAASFTRTSAATLTFTAGVNTPQNITLTCTAGAASLTANLQATETITGGATSSRFWVLNCPAGGPVPVGPTLTYNPTAGASAGTGGPVNFTGITTAGTTGNGSISATPSGGAASGTTTLGTFSISGADAASFTRTSAATLTFTAGINTPQNITLTCVSSTVARTANLQATETITGGATSSRFWVLNCPAGSVGPALAYNPTAGASAGTGGPVNFTGVTTAGTTGNGQVAVTPSGGVAAGTTTLGTFTISGADAASFTRTSAATLTFTAGINTPQNITLTCVSSTVARTANLQATETINGGATSQRFWVLSCPAGSLGPTLAYNPTAGASAGTGGPVNFTGITTAGTTGNGQVSVTPSGGVAAGTTTLGSFSISGADAASFTRTSGATLSFTAGINTPQNITLTCVSSTVARTANLQATETINGGATNTRFWVLSCPAGSQGPALAYNPTAGASSGTGGPVNFTGVTTVGSTGNGVIVATPSGGAVAGTTTLSGFSIGGADAASFTRTSGATLTFTAGINTPQNITLTCTSGAAPRSANLQATETITGGATSTRFWVLSCPAGGAIGPSMAFNPAAGASAGTGGPVSFTGVTTVGTGGSGQIVATPSGGAASGTTTLDSFGISGADAGSFLLTSAATLTFTAGVNTPQNITLTCTSGLAARSANLQATETVTGGATSTRFWVLSCPAGTAVPLGPSLAYNPTAGAAAGAGGPVNFTGVNVAGSAGSGLIIVTPSGGASAATTTLGSFIISGADAASFVRTSAATLSFTAGVTAAQNVTLSCTSGVSARSANLQATETITGGATSQRFWVLSCPSGPDRLLANGFETPDAISFDGFEDPQIGEQN